MYPNLEQLRIQWKILDHIRGNDTMCQFLKRFSQIKHITFDMDFCFSYVRALTLDADNICNALKDMKDIENEGIKISICSCLYQFPWLYGYLQPFDYGKQSVGKQTKEITAGVRELLKTFGYTFIETRINSVQDECILKDLGEYCVNLERFFFLHQVHHVEFSLSEIYDVLHCHK